MPKKRVPAQPLDEDEDEQLWVREEAVWRCPEGLRNHVLRRHYGRPLPTAPRNVWFYYLPEPNYYRLPMFNVRKIRQMGMMSDSPEVNPSGASAHGEHTVIDSDLDSPAQEETSRALQTRGASVPDAAHQRCAPPTRRDQAVESIGRRTRRASRPTSAEAVSAMVQPPSQRGKSPSYLLVSTNIPKPQPLPSTPGVGGSSAPSGSGNEPIESNAEDTSMSDGGDTSGSSELGAPSPSPTARVVLHDADPVGTTWETGAHYNATLEDSETMHVSFPVGSGNCCTSTNPCESFPPYDPDDSCDSFDPDSDSTSDSDSDEPDEEPATLLWTSMVRRTVLEEILNEQAMRAIQRYIDQWSSRPASKTADRAEGEQPAGKHIGAGADRPQPSKRYKTPEATEPKTRTRPRAIDTTTPTRSRKRARPTNTPPPETPATPQAYTPGPGGDSSNAMDDEVPRPKRRKTRQRSEIPETPQLSRLRPEGDRAGDTDSRSTPATVTKWARKGYTDPLPTYTKINTSKKESGMQLRGIEWLTWDGRRRALEMVDELLGRWGVTRSYEASCILVPKEWKERDVATLMAHFTVQDAPKIPSRDTTGNKRIDLKIGDHHCKLARATAWFSEDKWPRTGIELDNFMEIGPFQRHDGSHRCSQGFCIVPSHATFDTIDENDGRAGCADEAQDLRKQNKPIPRHCDRHDPPCFLQLAALTTLEACLVQFSVFRRASGLADNEWAPEIYCPKAHSRYGTFETSLPLSYSDVDADPAHLLMAKRIGVAGRFPKPDLKCMLCDETDGLVFAPKGVVDIWIHVIYRHKDVPTKKRLEAITEYATRWDTYWSQNRTYCAESDPTSKKLKQAMSPDFSWEDVAAWGLKPYS